MTTTTLNKRINVQRNFRKIIKRKIEKNFYKVSSKPLFKQKMGSFVMMILGLIFVIIFPDDAGGGLFTLILGLLMFCSKKDLTKDPLE